MKSKSEDLDQPRQTIIKLELEDLTNALLQCYLRRKTNKLTENWIDSEKKYQRIIPEQTYAKFQNNC